MVASESDQFYQKDSDSDEMYDDRVLMDLRQH